MQQLPWLSILWCLPAASAIALIALPTSRLRNLRGFAMLASAATLGLAGLLATGLLESSALTERAPWISTLGAEYHLAIDGIGRMMVLLVALVSFVAVTSSLRNVDRDDRAFHASVLLTEAAALGAVLAQDLLLFYAFFEAALLPVFVLTGWWGREGRVAAATRTIVFSSVGSAALLLAILVCYADATRAIGVRSFDLAVLREAGMPTGAAWLAFVAFAFGFAIRTPIFPLHSWYPESQSEAPTGAGLLTTGILLPLGVVSFARIAVPLVPEVSLDASSWMAGLGITGMLYGACLGMAQHDMRKRLGYIAISQLGFLVVGVFALDARSLAGSALHVASLGLALVTLLVLVGILDERFGARSLYTISGLGRRMPRFAAAFGLATCALVGIPGSGIFARELVTLAGVFAKHPPWAILAAISSVFVATYMLMLWRRVATGPFELPGGADPATARDLTLREAGVVSILIVASFGIGLAPQRFLDSIDDTTRPIAQSVETIRFDRLDESIAERLRSRPRPQSGEESR